MLSQKQLEDVCLLYGGTSKTCRYLRQDDLDPGKIHCLKHKKKDKSKIDKAVSDWVTECHKKGIDPWNQNKPIGDNCAGFPVLKNTVQGYDIPAKP